MSFTQGVGHYIGILKNINKDLPFGKAFTPMLKGILEKLIKVMKENKYIKPIKEHTIKMIEADASELALGGAFKQTSNNNQIDYCRFNPKVLNKADIQKHITWKEQFGKNGKNI